MKFSQYNQEVLVQDYRLPHQGQVLPLHPLLWQLLKARVEVLMLIR
jgi:hypothetical protein